MGADVLIGQSYYLRFDAKLWKAMQPYPPLGSLYAASHVRELGFKTVVFDAMLAASTEEWARALERHQPRFAVLYEDSFNYLSKMCLSRMREAAFAMIQMARKQGATVIVSSSDSTDHCGSYFEKGADFILIGEGEIALGELMAALSGSAKGLPEQVPGVVAPDFRAPPRGLLRDLDRLPFPARDLVDMGRYREVWMQRHRRFSVNVVTTRGCPYQCNWCAKPIYGQKYHARSALNVVQEMEWLAHNVKPDHIWFCDDIFGLKPGWIGEFSEQIEARNLHIPFKCLLRTDLVTEQVAWDLRRSGCESVWVGAESGSQRILDAMDKGTTVGDTRAATRILRKQGIRVGFFLQFGYKDESWDEIQQTLSLVRECMPDDIGVSVAYPLPGTAFYRAVRSQLGDKHNWVDSQDLAMLYSGPFSTAFYRQLHKTLHKEYRGRKALNTLRQGSLKGLPSLLKTATLPLERRRLSRMRDSAHSA